MRWALAIVAEKMSVKSVSDEANSVWGHFFGWLLRWETIHRVGGVAEEKNVAAVGLEESGRNW